MKKYRMKYTEVFNYGGEKLALVETEFAQLQMQVDYSGDHAYINLSLLEVKSLINKLNEWVFNKEASRFEKNDLKKIETAESQVYTDAIMQVKSKYPYIKFNLLVHAADMITSGRRTNIFDSWPAYDIEALKELCRNLGYTTSEY